MKRTRAATTAHRLAALAGLARRVQTPTLAMIVRRDLEINAFGPRTTGRCRPSSRRPRASATWACGSRARRTALKTAGRPHAIAALAEGRRRGRRSVERKPLVEQSPLLYDLTTLQREANQRYGFTAKRTLAAAARAATSAKGADLSRTASATSSSDLVPSLPSASAARSRPIRSTRRPRPRSRACAAPTARRGSTDAKVGDHHAIIPDRRDALAVGPLERRAPHLRHGRAPLPGDLPSSLPELPRAGRQSRTGACGRGSARSPECRPGRRSGLGELGEEAGWKIARSGADHVVDARSSLERPTASAFSVGRDDRVMVADLGVVDRAGRRQQRRPRIGGRGLLVDRIGRDDAADDARQRRDEVRSRCSATRFADRSAPCGARSSPARARVRLAVKP